MSSELSRWRRVAPLPAGCFAALFTVLALTSVARADCPNAIDGSASVDALDEDSRDRWLRSFLEDERSNARLWNWSFIAVGVGGVAGNLTLGAISSYTPRVARYFAAGAAGGLIVTAGLNPLRVANTEGTRSMPSCERLHLRERALVTLAEDEARRRSALYHVVPLVSTTAAGAVLALAYDNQWRNAIVNTVMAYVVTEFRIFVAPNRARTALHRYRQGDIGGDGAKAAWMVAPAALGQNGSGLLLSVVY